MEQEFPEFKPDQPIPFDIVEGDGKILFGAGTRLNQEQIRQLQERGLKYQPLFQTVVEEKLCDPYDLESMNRLKEYGPQLLRDVFEVVASANNMLGGDLGKIFQTLNAFEKIIQRDHSLVQAYLTKWATEEATAMERLSIRSARFSLLTSLTALAMGRSIDEARTVGAAALLHDFDRLVRCFESKVPEYSDDEEYRLHPLRSAEYFRQISSLPSDCCVLIEQVHEQVDGQGFPRNHLRDQLHPLSPLLNLVDAYLTLLEEGDSRPAIPPADAVAYLVYHAREDRFDLASLRGFLHVTSMYPVGTKVALSDSSVATIHRSTGETFTSPIVRIDRTEEIVDLRRSPHFITEPLSDHGNTLRGRLPLSEFSRILWIP